MGELIHKWENPTTFSHRLFLYKKDEKGKHKIKAEEKSKTQYIVFCSFLVKKR